MDNKLNKLDNLIEFLKEKRLKRLEEFFNEKFVGKYIKLDLIEEGFISAKVRKINLNPFNNEAEIEGAIVGNLDSLQEWTEYELGIGESFFIEVTRLMEFEEITEEEFIEDFNKSLQYFRECADDMINYSKSF